MQHGLGGQRGTTGPARLAATRRLGRRLIAACTRACAAAAATVTDSPTAAGGGVGEEGELPRGEGLRKTEVGREEARQVRRAAEGPMLSACRETKHAHARTHKMVERDEDSKLGPARPSDCRRLTRALLGGGATLLFFRLIISVHPPALLCVCAFVRCLLSPLLVPPPPSPRRFTACRTTTPSDRTSATVPARDPSPTSTA